MTDSKNSLPFETCLHKLCFPYDGFSKENLKQQEDAKRCFLESLKYVGLLLKSLPNSTSGSVEFANRALVSGNINDLLLAFHATSSGYYVQARNLMRPILESANLIILFCQDPDKVDSWIEGGKSGKRNLSPAAVRAALYGKDAIDPMEVFYSFLCEAGSHPRFTGTKSHVAMKNNEDKENTQVPQITAFIGGKRFYPEHTMTLFTCLFMPCIIILSLFTAYPELIDVDKKSMLTSFENILRFAENYLPDSEEKKSILNMSDNLMKMQTAFKNI